MLTIYDINVQWSSFNTWVTLLSSNPHSKPTSATHLRHHVFLNLTNYFFSFASKFLNLKYFGCLILSVFQKRGNHLYIEVSNFELLLWNPSFKIDLLNSSTLLFRQHHIFEYCNSWWKINYHFVPGLTFFFLVCWTVRSLLSNTSSTDGW